MNTTDMDKKTSVGKMGETLACRYLISKGYAIVKTNFQNKKGYKIGELDIIAKKNEEIIFVEVKTRIYTKEAIFPEENVTASKLQKLEKIASLYMRSYHDTYTLYHFDVISIIVDLRSKKAKVRHLEHVFL